MGIFCQGCDSKKDEINETKEKVPSSPAKDINLPKLFVNDEDKLKLNQEFQITKKNDKKKEQPVLSLKIDNKENVNNNKKVIKEKFKKYIKAKSIMFNKESNQNFSIKKMILESNRSGTISEKIPRINSLKLSKEKKAKIISNEIKLITELESKKTEVSLMNPKLKLSNSTTRFEQNNTKKSTKTGFVRRKKKSTTLMQNNMVFNQLRNFQMSIPLFQETLIPHQKGTPNEKYIQGRKMGSGSYGTVYEATNITFKTTVAMKKIIKDESMNEELIRNEIDILKKLSHPNIVKIYEFYETNNCFYLVNEMCAKGELFNYINRSTLDEQQLAIIFYQVFSGLCYLHENNILHRDIKPENILISSKEKDLNTDEEYFWIKIIDFGTAKIFLKGEKEKKIIGSAYYIAPEVLNKNYNEKCDTWSVGVILYMFLVGRAPFDGKNNEDILRSIATQEYNSKNERLLLHSKEVQDLIKNLLNKKTEKRFSAKEALNHEWFKKFNGRKLFSNFNEEDMKPYINNLFNYTFQSKIQQLVLAFLVHNMPTLDKSNNILKLYRFFNKSGDCKLSKDELIEGLCLYMNKLEIIKKVDMLFRLLDSDNNGYIEYEEFLRACVDKNEILTNSNLKYAFKFLDQKGKGKLSAKEIVFAFFNKENQLFEIALSKDINDEDGDGDGEINFDEFVRLITKVVEQ